MKFNRRLERRACLALALVVTLVGACKMGAGAGDVGAFTGGAGGGGGEGGEGGIGGGGGDGTLLAGAVASGAAHSCALVDGGSVMCWGDGTRGQLGDGIASKGYRRAVPGFVQGISGATAIRAGGDTTCAILAGGAVACWGEGSFGQLGNSVAKDGYFSATPVMVSGLSGVVDLSISGTNACALSPDGAIHCWGRNAPETWLGFTSEDCGPYTVPSADGPSKLISYPCESTPRLVPGAKGAVSVTSGGAHNCLRTKEGEARCWGSDQFGQLGDGTFGPTAFQADPALVSGISDVQLLALGASHTCAIAGSQGGVRCWGDNAYGQLGIGTDALDSYKVKPVEVAALDGVIDLSSSTRTTCAARGDGSVLCWGDTSTVLPVSPDKNVALVPTKVPGLISAQAVRTGGAHACALLDDATVVCWGSNDRGQLGTGGFGVSDFSFSPVMLPVDEPD